eukprot:317502-Pelagomonas_calceolata.AAC.4
MGFLAPNTRAYGIGIRNWPTLPVSQVLCATLGCFHALTQCKRTKPHRDDNVPNPEFHTSLDAVEGH